MRIGNAEPSVSKGYKWELLLWLSLSFFTHQAGRAVLGMVTGDVQADLHLSDDLMGLIPSILSVVLAVMIPISGILGDRFSRKWIITWTLIIGSAATALAGASVGFFTLVLFYSVTSATCEAMYAPSGYSLIAAFHHSTRSIAMSIHQSALYIGVMTCGIGAAFIAERWGWRWAFAVFGLFGVFLGLIAIFRLKDPPPDERPAAKKEKDVGTWDALKLMFTTPSTLMLLIGFLSIVFVNNIYWFWVPKYMQQEGLFALTKQQSSGVLTYHIIPAMVTILGGGMLSDLFVKKDPKFRVRLQAVALLLGAPMLYFLGEAKTVNAVWFFCAAYGVCRGLFEVNTHTTLYDLVPARMRAKAAGFLTMTGFLIGGTLGTWLVGLLMDKYGTLSGMQIGFKVMAGVYAFGGVAMLYAWLVSFDRDRIREVTAE